MDNSAGSGVITIVFINVFFLTTVALTESKDNIDVIIAASVCKYHFRYWLFTGELKAA